MGRRRTPRMTGLNVTHHTLAKIKRIGLRHHKSPPTGSESHSHPRRNPHRFNLTVRCSSKIFVMGGPQWATRKKGRPKPPCRPTRTVRSPQGSRRAFVAAIRRRRRAEGLGFRGPAPYPVPVVSTMAWCIYDVNRAPHSKEATEKGARKPPSRLLDRPAYALGSCLPYRGVPWSWARR